MVQGTSSVKSRGVGHSQEGLVKAEDAHEGTLEAVVPVKSAQGRKKYKLCISLFYCIFLLNYGFRRKNNKVREDLKKKVKE